MRVQLLSLQKCVLCCYLLMVLYEHFIRCNLQSDPQDGAP